MIKNHLFSLPQCKKEMKKVWRIYVLKDPNKGEGKGMKRFNRFTHQRISNKSMNGRYGISCTNVVG
jgi:hypothetical protein